MPATKRKLVEAAIELMLQHGFTATSVDRICERAQLTKGSFFHYFKSKEQLAEAALDCFAAAQREMTEQAPFWRLADPLDRLHGLLDFMAEVVRQPEFPQACLVGNLSQELAATHDGIRDRCRCSFDSWTANVAALLREARTAHPPAVEFDPDSVARMILSLLQGSILLAKAHQDPGIIQENLRHCRAYLDGLFAGQAAPLPPLAA